MTERNPTDVLLRYVQHENDCDLRGHWMQAAECGCTCGLSEAIAAINALPAVDEWQLIATAPPEQVPLLLWAKRECDPTFRQVCGWRYEREWAIYGCGKTQVCVDIIQPTHWKPQGQPPQ